ncbi:MAG: 30S ribosomal protein S9, partial [Oscillospiraceae bacterium]|nr:30S ribosomal protein S9 [Oscillospiraceae bacterium]
MYEPKVAYHYGTGRRKHSVSRVRLVPGTGNITINGRSIDDYFGLETLKLIVRQPLALTDTTEKFDVICTVEGGGVTCLDHLTGKLDLHLNGSLIQTVEV